MKSTDEVFAEAWNKYWYEKKTLSQKLVDSGTEELKICALFFESLNELGYLDKAYELKNPLEND